MGCAWLQAFEMPVHRERTAGDGSKYMGVLSRELCRKGQRTLAERKSSETQAKILACFDDGKALTAKQIAKTMMKKISGNIWRHLHAMTGKGLLIQTHGIGRQKQKTITFRRSGQ